MIILGVITTILSLILILLLIVLVPSSVIVEEDLTKSLRESETVDKTEAMGLLCDKLSRYAYIEDNKIKIKVLKK